MIYFAQVLEIVKRASHYKIVVGVNIGYGIDCHTLCVDADKLADGLEIGDKILFTGYRKSRDGIEQFYTESIFKRSFASCEECGLPLTSETCLLKHDKEAQKLIGQWKIVHKIESRGCIKLFFEKGHYVFATVAAPNQWIYPTFQKLVVDNQVELEGWRYKQCTSLIFIKKLELSI
jgi:hypothetical protein